MTSNGRINYVKRVFQGKYPALFPHSNKWSNMEFGEYIGIIEIIICTLSGALIDSHRREWVNYLECILFQAGSSAV